MLSKPSLVRWLFSATIVMILFATDSQSGSRLSKQSGAYAPTDAIGIATHIDPRLVRAELVWEFGAPQVDIWRDGVRIDTVVNVGYYATTFDAFQGATGIFHICNAGTTDCYEEVNLTYSLSGGPPSDCPAAFANVGLVANGTLRACRLPQVIIGDFTVSARAGTVYQISSRVDVGQDQGGDLNAPRASAQRAELFIEPGVWLFGASGLDYIVLNRGSQIFAEGTATNPIVFTSRQSIEGQTTVDSIGQWGGVVLLGRAPIANCPGTALPGMPACEAQVEGPSMFYGGNAPSDNSGRFRYVRVQHSGFQIIPNNELNGITLAGLGTGTVFEYVQVHNSSDDGFEWFGGTVNARYLVATGNDDDSFDTDAGFVGSIQFGIVVQRAGGGDRMNEMSSVGQQAVLPSNPKFANITYVGRAGGGAGIAMNFGTNSRFFNTVVTRPAGGTGPGAACLDVDDATTTGTFNSVFFSCPIAFDDDGNGQAAALFNAGTNNTAAGTSTLTATFINGANETAVPAFANLPSISPFFQQVNYIGGVRDASDTWWQGWTCGLTAATSCHAEGGNDPPTGLIARYAFPLKQHRIRVPLRWEGGDGQQVDIRFDSAVFATVQNDGTFTHTFARQGAGTVSYQVCNAGTTQCSAEIDVTYRSRP